MKIKNSTLTFFKNTAILTFLIDNITFQKSMARGDFNFEKELFESMLPADFSKGQIALIADKVKAEGYEDGKEFELEPSQWNILNIIIDGKKYETFLSLRLNGKLPGTIEEAVTQFSVLKAKSNQEISKQTEDIVKETIADILNLALSKNINPFNLNSIFQKLISKITGSIETFNFETTIPSYLKEMGIPYVIEEDSYLFSVSAEEDSWNIEIRPSESMQSLLIFSYLRIEATPATLLDLKKDIDAINLEFNYGEVEIDQEQNLFILTSEIETFAIRSSEELKLALNPIFESMKALILVVKGNFENKILFTKMEVI
jgi:hypothetical protein